MGRGNCLLRMEFMLICSRHAGPAPMVQPLPNSGRRDPSHRGPSGGDGPFPVFRMTQLLELSGVSAVRKTGPAMAGTCFFTAAPQVSSRAMKKDRHHRAVRIARDPDAQSWEEWTDQGAESVRCVCSALWSFSGMLSPRRSSRRSPSCPPGSFTPVPAQWEPELIGVQDDIPGGCGWPGKGSARDDIQCLNDQVFLVSGRTVWQGKEYAFFLQPPGCHPER